MTACEAPAETPEVPLAIGAELLGFNTALGVPGCVEGHLYWVRDRVQLQCFASDGSFSWENHGTLTAEGESELLAALEGVDLGDSSVVDEMGLCEGPESSSAQLTLWVEGASISYAPGCPTQGILELHELSSALLGDISDCTEFELLTSVDPGCRAY